MTSWMRLLQQVIDRANKIAWDRANVNVPQTVNVQAPKPHASKPSTVSQPPPPPPPPPPNNENSHQLSNTVHASEASLASTWKDSESGRSSRANTFADSPIPVSDGIGTGNTTTGTMMSVLAGFSSVGVWLDSMELRQYEPIFEARGYDNVETVLGTGLRDDFLDTLGIVDPLHRSILQTSGIQSYCNGLKVNVSKWRVFGPIVVFTG